MPRHYYCLIAGLPDISIEDNKLSYTQSDFREELGEALHPKDFVLLESLFLPYDHQNILNILEGGSREFDTRALYTKEELEEELANKELSDLFPSYIRQFVEAYKEDETIVAGLSWENQLTSLYYDYALKTKNAFMREWLTYELNIKNVLAAINCREHDMPLDGQIIGDNEIARQLKSKGGKDFGLTSDFPDIEILLQWYDNKNLQEREKGIDLHKWNWLDENTFFHYFTIERIVAYTIKLAMVERWLTLDEEHGRQLFEKLLHELENSYNFPEEYAV